MFGIRTYILFSLVAAGIAHSQGTVNFVSYNTAVTPIIDAHVEYSAGGVMSQGLADSAITVTDPLTQITYGGLTIRVGLYGGPAGSAEKDLVLLSPAVGVGTGALAGYVDSGPDTIRTVTGVAPGQPAVIQLRGWDAGLAPGETLPAASWAEANQLAQLRSVYMGKTRLIDIAALGGDGLPPAELFGLPNFDLPWFAVPEPSVWLLLLLGLLGFRIRKRRA